jgi:hypothetical protein
VEHAWLDCETLLVLEPRFLEVVHLDEVQRARRLGMTRWLLVLEEATLIHHAVLVQLCRQFVNTIYV